jgi:hypothetical protein
LLVPDIDQQKEEGKTFMDRVSGWFN